MNVPDGVLWIKRDNGEFEKMGEFSDIEEFTEDNETFAPDPPSFKWLTNEVTFTAEINGHASRKRLYNLFMYGWYAKGHLRKVPLRKCAQMKLRRMLNELKDCRV